MFQSTCALAWPAVQKEASSYIGTLEQICPQYLDEMGGVAEGAGVDLLDILALNVRTEIVFSLFTEDPEAGVKVDGCTSVALKTCAELSLLAQNWDWQEEQGRNLFVCHISQPGTDIPDLAFVTEGGIIGKIGFNSYGVGVCLNAIRARGVDKSKLPVHLGLRAALESKSRQDAVRRLMSDGIAGSAHILVADEDAAVGLECTVKGIKELEMDKNSRIVHTNHLLLDHTGVDEPPWLRDSPERLTRMHRLLDEKVASSDDVGVPELLELFKDEDGYPCSINRAQAAGSDLQTIFNIVMELPQRQAVVRFGRPTDGGDSLQLRL